MDGTCPLGTVQEPPMATRTTCLKSTGSTPQICPAVRPPFVMLCLAGFKALKKGKRRSTPPICTAVRLPFVPQYASHLYRQYFEKIPVGGSGKFLILQQYWVFTSLTEVLGRDIRTNDPRFRKVPDPQVTGGSLSRRFTGGSLSRSPSLPRPIHLLAPPRPDST